jgi:hypothetical protein
MNDGAGNDDPSNARGRPEHQHSQHTYGQRYRRTWKWTWSFFFSVLVIGEIGRIGSQGRFSATSGASVWATLIDLFVVPAIGAIAVASLINLLVAIRPDR